jgi:predicted RNA binding protein YcfA (HicA-like mRNA interferase family)
MPLKPLPYREVKRKLEAAGFYEVSIKGSHVKYLKQTDHGTLIAIVPRHRELSPGTLRSILRQAGLSVAEFDDL